MPKLEWFVGNFWLIVAMISAAVMGGHDLLFNSGRRIRQFLRERFIE